MKCKHPRKTCPWACEGYIDACAYELGQQTQSVHSSSDTVITIRLERKLFDGIPTHWESNAAVDGQWLMDGTGPTFAGVLDLALDSIQDSHREALSFDANNKGET